ncbi:MAG: GNAT family N-acetyltransferase [Dehalococcoidia bacterium]
MAIAAIEPTLLRKDQLRESGEVLARAFHTNPLMEYILPDEERRRRALPWFMAAGSKYGLRFGEVHTTPGAIAGSAIWLPPGNSIASPLRMAQVGLLAAPFKMGLGGFRRFMGATNHLEHLHKRDVPQPHWYLMILGVDPLRQRQGIGSALLQPVLAKADAAHLPCYLETDKEDDVIFYQRNGFEVVVADTIPNGPRYWTMLRPAK